MQQIISGRPVKQLQTLLRDISAYDPRILPVIPDGYYGGITTAAVRSFQEAYNLPVTGIADFSTWNHIVQTWNALPKEPPTIQPVWNAETKLSPGEQNLHFYLVQAMLTALSHRVSNLDPPDMHVGSDQSTEQGIRWIQRIGGIPETGILDTESWKFLNGLYRTIVANGTIP